LPATYKVDQTHNLAITFKPDGTYTYVTALKCAAVNCMGSGKWEADKEGNTVTLKQKDMQGNNIYQTWQFGAMTRDARVSRIWGNRMVDAMGMFGSVYPLPRESSSWTRSD
ncbi:hypothetical protein BCR44DRAFT_45385, partial [Catenaria anguillulae PL171]